VLALVIAVHTAPAAARRRARTDDFTIPHRDELEAALDRGAEVAECGPYARPAAALVAGHAPVIRRRLARYDELAAQGCARPDRMVLTHGEPHPGNTMLTAAGWRLIDWDTVLVAPPERDLWLLDPGDGSTLAAYTAATGVSALPAMLELYRLRWDLADVAVEVSRFRRRHAGTEDDDRAWEILRSWIEKAAT
jgi:spectinomycin phosphotransferase/16S rRNA (guanine(1405)-N(7))-methyltransferase